MIWPIPETNVVERKKHTKIGKIQRFLQTLHRLVAQNEVNYPEIIKHVRSKVFIDWYDKFNNGGWDWKFEADIDVMQYVIFVTAATEGFRESGGIGEFWPKITIDQRKSILRGAKIYRDRQLTEKCSRKRYIALCNASSPWADPEKIDAIYAASQRISKITGIEHHVDHVIPLQGKQVCGLHVEANLRIVTKKDNLLKNNKFISG